MSYFPAKKITWQSVFTNFVELLTDSLRKNYICVMKKLKSLTKSAGKKRAKHYEPKLKIHGSFEQAIKALVSESKTAKK